MGYRKSTYKVLFIQLIILKLLKIKIIDNNDLRRYIKKTNLTIEGV